MHLVSSSGIFIYRFLRFELLECVRLFQVQLSDPSCRGCFSRLLYKVCLLFSSSASCDDRRHVTERINWRWPLLCETHAPRPSAFCAGKTHTRSPNCYCCLLRLRHSFCCKGWGESPRAYQQPAWTKNARGERVDVWKGTFPSTGDLIAASAACGTATYT